MYLAFLIPLSIIIGFVYLYIRFISTLSEKRAVRLGYLAVLTGIFGLMLFTFGLKHNGVSGNAADLFSWISFICVGCLSFLLSFIMLRDFVLFWWWLCSGVINKSRLIKNKAELLSPQRRTFLSGTFTSVIFGSAMSFTGLGVFFAQRIPEVKNVMLPVKNLPKDLESFSIVQISDIHLSSTCKKDFLEKVVRTVNSLKPDIIALTGDLADGVVDVLGGDAEPLKDLVAKYGKFFVTGNHEYYFKANEWIKKVESLGFKTLTNEHELVQCKSGKILMAGVADYRAGYFIKSHESSPAKAIENAPATDVKILLAHQPKSVFEASKAGYDIQISGHTHGGQFFPWQLAIGIDQPYLAGLYKHDKMQIYVSRGTGYWGPPIRMGAPSEISLLKLTKE